MEEKIITMLRNKGLLIDPDNLEPYLKSFADVRTAQPSPDFWRDRRVFITGINGFAGSHLSEKLIELGAKVSGLVRRHSVPNYPNISHLMDSIELYEGNLEDINSLYSKINSVEPEVIFHLGAQSFVPTSFKTPIETYKINVLGTANILEVVRNARSDLDAVHIAGSSEEYGKVYPDEVPISEKNPLRPLSPYAASKVAKEMIVLTHHRCYGLPVVITRAFNHTGIRRGVQFVGSVIAKQIAKIKKGGSPVITLGNIEPIRDFTDVRDTVRGYMLAVEKGKKAEPYNIGHGFGISIGNLAKLSANVAGLKKFRIEIDKSRYRPAEVEILICDYTKARNELGYRPTIPLTETMLGNIEYFMEHQDMINVERH